MINDTYGHQIGDVVLKEISQITSLHIREQDIPVRWGGEEFLVLLPHTNLSGSIIVANKIKTAIETNLFTDLNLNITASFGVTQLVNEDDDESLIARADKHLYEAKNSGKNKVIATK